MTLRTLLVVAVIGLSAVIGWFVFDWQHSRSTARAFGAPFTLVDQRGDEITQEAFRGQPSAVFFGFTHCPEICPTTLFELDGWLAELGEEGSSIEAFFVSVDPERDTPEIMEQYVGNVSGRITGITGNPPQVLEMAKSFGIYVNKVELEDGDYTVDHTASILLLDRDGDFAGTIAYGEDPVAATAKLRRLATGS